MTTSARLMATGRKNAGIEERLRLSEIVGAFAELTTDLDRAFDEIVRRIAETMRDGCLLALLSEDGTTLVSGSRYHVSRGRDFGRSGSVPIAGYSLAQGVPAARQRPGEALPGHRPRSRAHEANRRGYGRLGGRHQ